jgi:ATP-dependent RNA helicase DOB1
MNSAFHLSYNMILNLLRVEGISPEFMLERCFYTFQNDASLPQFETELSKLNEEKDSIVVEDEDEIGSYYELRKQIEIYTQDVRDVMNHPTYALPFLQPGRLVRVKHDKMDFGWGAVVNFEKQKKKGKREETDDYIIFVLLNCSQDSSPSKDANGETVGVKPAPEADQIGRLFVVPVLLNTIECYSHIRLVLPKSLRKNESLKSVFKSIQEVKKRFPDDIPLLDPIKNMGIKDAAFEKLVNKIVILEKKMMEHPLAKSETLPELYDKYMAKMEVMDKIKAIKKKISDAQSIIQLEELKNRKRVMRR